MLLARFVAVFGACACGIMLVGTVVGALYNPGHGYQAGPLLRAFVILTGLIVVEALWAWRSDVWWAHVYVITAVLTIVLAVSSIGEYAYMASVMAFAVLVAGIALIGTRGATLVHVACIVVAYAAMAMRDGHTAPLIETWTVGGSALVVGGLVSWLVGLAAARADGDRRARAELETVNARQSAFLANMSHELRTPLNAILGFADLLGAGAAGPMSERQAEYLDDVRGSGQHLLALIDDVLDLAKVEEGKTELYVGRVELAPTLGAAAALFHEQAGRHRITIDAAIATGIGAIEADERKVKQVVFNLLSNAVRFTPDGGRVELGARRTGAGVEIWIADSGPGIAADEQEQIFEEYHQAAPSADARQPGTGLGLALVRKFVELHGGRITVRSQPGRGAVFTVALPLAPNGAATTEDADADATRVRPTRGQWWELRSIEGNVAPGSPENRRRVGQLVSALVIAGTTLVAGAQLMYLWVDAPASYRPRVSSR